VQFSSKFKYAVENLPTSQYELEFKCPHAEGLRYHMMPTLLFADLPVESFTINGLKKWIDLSVK
jgi:hypothetical protein